jgi:GntR family transcriptional regulator
LNIQISNSSGEPIYEQIRNGIRGAILSGELPPGTLLPSIRQLAKDLQISVITTKRAYEELEREGLIDSIVGKGSYVSGANEAFIREQRLRDMESKLQEAIKEGKSLGLEVEEIIGHIRLLYREGEREA